MQIYDFLCLGTEAKLLNALLGLKGANLTAGYGVANYCGSDNAYGDSVMKRMYGLVNIRDAGFGYRIAGTRDEIKNMLIEKGEDDEPGLYKI